MVAGSTSLDGNVLLRAVLVDGYAIGVGLELQVHDLHDPANISQVFGTPIDMATHAILRGDMLYLVGASGIQVWDFADPTQPALLRTVAMDAFAPDQAASRSDYVGNASWTLRGVDGTVVGSGQVTERASFNFADAAYADMAAQTAAQERLADLLARSIRSEMIIAAGRQKTGEPIKAAPEATIPKPTVPTSTNPTRQ